MSRFTDQSQIDLGFHCFYLETTWKIHGILCHQIIRWNPDYDIQQITALMSSTRLDVTLSPGH